MPIQFGKSCLEFCYCFQVPYEIVKFLLPVIPCSRRYEAFSKMDKELISMPLGTHVNIHKGHQSAHIVGEVKFTYINYKL